MNIHLNVNTALERSLGNNDNQKRKYTKKSDYWLKRQTKSSPIKNSKSINLLPPLEIKSSSDRSYVNCIHDKDYNREKHIKSDMNLPSTSSKPLFNDDHQLNLFDFNYLNNHINVNNFANDNVNENISSKNSKSHYVKGKGKMLIRNFSNKNINNSNKHVNSDTSIKRSTTPTFLLNYLSDSDEDDKFPLNHDAKSALIRKRKQLKKVKSETVLNDKINKNKKLNNSQNSNKNSKNLVPKTPELAPTSTYHDRFLHGLPYARNVNDLYFSLPYYSPSENTSKSTSYNQVNQSPLFNSPLNTPLNLINSSKKSSKLSSGLGITPKFALDDLTDYDWRHHHNLFSSPTFNISSHSPSSPSLNNTTTPNLNNSNNSINLNSSSTENSLILTPINKFNDQFSNLTKHFNDFHQVYEHFDLENALNEF